MDYSNVPTPTSYYQPDKTDDLEVIRAKHLSGMQYDMDLTAMNGPVTAHERLTVVLFQHGAKNLVRAVRDTGSPDTIITRRMAELLGLKLEPCTETYGVLGSN